MCPFSTLNCELIKVSYHVLCIFTSLYFQTVAQCLWIHSNNIYWWRNAGVSEWSLPFWLVASLPLLLVNFHCGARTHMRSALLGAQYEVDSQRYWWKHVTLLGSPFTTYRGLHTQGRGQSAGAHPEMDSLSTWYISQGRKTSLTLDHWSAPLPGSNIPNK